MLLSQSLWLQAQIPDWSKAYGGEGGADLSYLAKSADGIVIGGSFLQSFPLDGNNTNSAGGTDIFILWLDSLGNTQKSLFIGNTNNDFLRGMDSDHAGNIYIAGEFRGTLQLGNFTLQSLTQSNFLAKIDITGQVVWAELIYGKGTNRILDLQLDVHQENILISGYFNDSLQLQGQAMYETAMANLFVIKTTTDGTLRWMQKTPRSVEAKAWSIAALPDGKIWVAAEFRDSIYMPQDTFFIHPFYSDILLTQLDSNGQWLQSKQWGGVYHDRPRRLRRSPDHNTLWMGGEFVGILNFDNNIQLITAFRYYDFFWAKINTDGTCLAAGQSNTIANAYLYDLVVADDAVWLGGYYQDSLLGYNQTYQTKGGFDAYWFRIDSSTAALTASRSIGGAGNDLLSALLTKENAIILGGSFQQTISIAAESHTAAGFSNIWLTWMQENIASPILRPEIPKLLALKIVPNPSSDSFRIVLEVPLPLTWELYALNGQRIAKGNTEVVSVAQLPVGTYSLLVFTEQGMGVEKIIKH